MEVRSEFVVVVGFVGNDREWVLLEWKVYGV